MSRNRIHQRCAAKFSLDSQPHSQPGPPPPGPSPAQVRAPTAGVGGTGGSFVQDPWFHLRLALPHFHGWCDRLMTHFWFRGRGLLPSLEKMLLMMLLPLHLLLRLSTKPLLLLLRPCLLRTVVVLFERLKWSDPGLGTEESAV